MPIYRHLEKYKYDTSAHPLRIVCAIFIKVLIFLSCIMSIQIGLVSMVMIHPLFCIKNSMICRRKTYPSLSRIFGACYLSILGEPFYFQVVPCIRLGFPGKKWLDRYHVDTDYNHPIYELNINLAINPTPLPSAH